ncbi:MAG: flap endonuclease [Pseudomonadales bacterium]|nr:flap endonuclease [Pseudomonadales bacterium]
MTAAAPVYLLDASIYIFQAYFSPYNNSVDEAGQDLSAFVGFAQFLMSLYRRERPLSGAVAMDNALFTGFRHALSEEYKSNRELPDENLARQLDFCARAADVLGWPVFASTRYEADDIIGTLAKRSRSSGAVDTQGGVCIVSRDKDLAQLIRAEADVLWDFSSNRRRSRTDIERELGIPTTCIPDYLGLVGDSVDCIAGVPGVGPVKAAALLSEFGTMDGIYSNLDEVAAMPLRGAKALASKLSVFETQARRCKLLATIVEEPEDSSEAFANASIADLALVSPNLNEFSKLLEEARVPKVQLARMSEALVRLVEVSS